MKKLLSMILALSIVLTMFGGLGITSVNAEAWDGAVATGFGGGDGSEANPYLIATAAELAYFSQQINAGSGNTAYYKLTDNIDLNNQNWTDAGTSSNRFKGTFDGNGKVIKNLSITSTTVDQVTGLFGWVEDAVIKNLGMENVNISLSADATVYVGAIAGYAKNATIENCFVRGASLARTGSAAGLIGGVLGQVGSGSTVTLANCYVIDASLSSNDNIATYLGGLVGDANTNSNNTKLILTNCYVADLTLTSTNGQKGTFTQKTVTTAINVFDGDTVEPSEILNAFGYEKFGIVSDVNAGYPVLYWEITDSFNVIIDKSGSGTADADKATAKAGETVTLTVTPETDYAIDSVKVNGKELNPTDGIYSFNMQTRDVTVEVVFIEENTENAWDGSTAASFAGGDGSEANPYQISNGAELKYLSSSAESNTYENKYFILTSDIDLGDENWTEITNANGFKGTFDGNGHIIRNLSITDTSGKITGLFGRLYGEVKNLGIENVTATLSGSGAIYFGAIAGFVKYNKSINNCYVKNVTVDYSGSTTGGYGIGGIIGQCSTGETAYKLINSYAQNVTVTNSNSKVYAGGLVGHAKSGGSFTLTNCYVANVNITSNNKHYANGLYNTNDGKLGITTAYDGDNLGAEEVLTKLSASGFKKDNFGKNAGFPLLSWEKEIEADTFTFKNNSSDIANDSTVNSADEITLSAIFKNVSSGSSANVQLIIVAYENGALKNISIKDTSVNAARTTLETDAYSVPSGADTICGFLWSNDGTLKPLKSRLTLSVAQAQ